ncbi:MAG TPA: dihydroorotase family protein [Planctomycetota bacterium]|nr:dihydroorotase family protein [Planctomycetota bacterium]
MTRGNLIVRRGRSYPPGLHSRPLEVLIEDGRIAQVGERIELDASRPAPEVLDAAGLVVIPGLIDLHVHFREPGLEHKEGWDHGSAGALHGGVTSVVEVQNNPPLSTSKRALLDRIKRVRSRSRVDFGCLANLLEDSLPELDAMAALTPAFKCFLGGSTGLGGQTDPATIRRLFEAAARAGRPIVAHCEQEELLQAGKLAYPTATVREHHLVRSHAAEMESIRQSIDLVRECGVELHVFHLSSAGGVELVRAARREGLPVSASTGPNYLFLTCEDAERLGNLLKVNPSIKTFADRASLRAALADGTIDAIATDHAPHPLAEKMRPYAHAPSGMPSVDLLWPLTWELVRQKLLTAERALELVTRGPARSLHIQNKGELRAGFDGDLVLFDPDQTRRVQGVELPSRSRWSAFEGLELAGFPRSVVRRGELVWSEGRALVSGGGEPLVLGPVPPGPR